MLRLLHWSLLITLVYCCLLLSPVCMIHLLICAHLTSSPIACPPSSVLCKWLLYTWFNIYGCVICCSNEMSGDGIISFMLAMLPLDLLFLTLGYTACFSNFFASDVLRSVSHFLYFYVVDVLTWRLSYCCQTNKNARRALAVVGGFSPFASGISFHFSQACRIHCA